MNQDSQHDWSRRRVLALGVGGAAALGLPAGASHGAALTLVAQGQARAVIVRPDAPDAQVSNAIATLASYLTASTQATLLERTQAQLDSDPGLDDLVRLYVGLIGTDSEPGTATQMAGLNQDGYVIRSHTNSITIVGASSWGTRYGVYEFLERFVGVRWLMPGADGEDVPVATTLTIPHSMLRQEPKAISRVLAPITRADHEAPGWSSADTWEVWGSRNRLRYSIDFVHHLWVMFRPSKYAADHEIIYPMRAGTGRYIPASDQVHAGWQPRFSEPFLVTAGINEVVDYFANHPTRTSISLGVNDAGGYCVQELAGKPLNSLGFPNMSDLYYSWVKAVIEGAIAQVPSLAAKKFGVLAYQHTYDPPSFVLPSQVVPFICRERYGWVDPAIRSEQQATLQAWRAVATGLGWYDYNYGLTYAAPRISRAATAAAYQYAAQNDVVGEYAEINPNWGEGPKPWINAKLMWDASLDPEALLQDWCSHAVGPVAAPALVDYYKLWDQLWTTAVPSLGWFHYGKAETYFRFDSAAYLPMTTEANLATMRSHLQTITNNPGTAKQVARANLIKEAFGYYEVSRLSFPVRGNVPTASAQALALLDKATTQFTANSQRMTRITQLHQAQTISRTRLSDRGHTWSWNGWTFWQIHDYVKSHEPAGGPVTTRLTNEAANSSGVMQRFAALLLDVLGGAAPLLPNPSFEAGTATPSSWSLWRTENRGTLTRVTANPRTGLASLRATGVFRGGPYQVVTAVPGLLAARIFYTTSVGVSADATITLSCNLVGLAGSTLTTWGLLDIRQLAVTAGSYASTAMLLDIPAVHNGLSVGKLVIVATVSGLNATDSVHLDDFTVHQ